MRDEAWLFSACGDLLRGPACGAEVGSLVWRNAGWPSCPALEENGAFMGQLGEAHPESMLQAGLCG